MIIDHESKNSNNNRIIEVLIVDKKTSVWIPAMATDLRLMNKQCDLVKIKEIRVRDLAKEKKNNE